MGMCVERGREKTINQYITTMEFKNFNLEKGLLNVYSKFSM